MKQGILGYAGAFKVLCDAVDILRYYVHINEVQCQESFFAITDEIMFAWPYASLAD